MIQGNAILNAPRHRRRLTGEQLGNNRLELTFLPSFGCHWTRLRLSVKGEWIDFLMPAPDGDSLLDRPTGQGSYILAPWSNRIPKGMLRFEAKTYHVQPNFADGSAIHGDVRMRPWRVVQSSRERFDCVLETADFDDFNYPFSLRFHHTLELIGEQLNVRMEMQNIDRGRVPVGLGYHPYFLRRPTWRDEDVLLVVPAEKVYPLEQCLPTGPAQPVSGPKDLRGLDPLGPRSIDDCYTALTENQARLIYPGSRVEVRLEFDPCFSHLIVHAPNNGRNGFSPSYVAVEPLTHVTNGFNLHEDGWKETGVKILEPGESWTTSWSLSVGDI